METNVDCSDMHDGYSTCSSAHWSELFPNHAVLPVENDIAEEIVENSCDDDDSESVVSVTLSGYDDSCIFNREELLEMLRFQAMDVEGCRNKPGKFVMVLKDLGWKWVHIRSVWWFQSVDARKIGQEVLELTIMAAIDSCSSVSSDRPKTIHWSPRQSLRSNNSSYLSDIEEEDPKTPAKPRSPQMEQLLHSNSPNTKYKLHYHQLWSRGWLWDWKSIKFSEQVREHNLKFESCLSNSESAGIMLELSKNEFESVPIDESIVYDFSNLSIPWLRFRNFFSSKDELVKVSEFLGNDRFPDSLTDSELVELYRMIILPTISYDNGSNRRRRRKVNISNSSAKLAPKTTQISKSRAKPIAKVIPKEEDDDDDKKSKKRRKPSIVLSSSEEEEEEELPQSMIIASSDDVAMNTVESTMIICPDIDASINSSPIQPFVSNSSSNVALQLASPLLQQEASIQDSPNDNASLKTVRKVIDVVKNCFSLDVDANELLMIAREDETETITQFISSSLKKRASGCCYVCGRPGSGKSAIVQEAKRLIMLQINREEVPGPKYVLALSGAVMGRMKRKRNNNKDDDDDDDSWMSVLEQMGLSRSDMKCDKVKVKKFAVNKLLDPSSPDDNDSKSRKKRREMCLMIVDEADQMDSKAMKILMSIAAEPSSSLILIAIGNHLNYTSEVLKLSQNSIPRQVILFSSYRHEQLKKIIVKRLGRHAVFDDQALNLISRKGEVSGDARWVLELAQTSVDIAEFDFVRKLMEVEGLQAAQLAGIPTSRLWSQLEMRGAKLSSEFCVKPIHVFNALRSVLTESSASELAIESLPLLAMIVLSCASASFDVGVAFTMESLPASLDGKNFPFDDQSVGLYDSCRSICSRILSHEDLISQAQLREIIHSVLIPTGLLSVSGFIKGSSLPYFELKVTVSELLDIVGKLALCIDDAGRTSVMKILTYGKEQEDARKQAWEAMAV